MIGPSGAVRVMVATRPVDFRKGAEGLAALVRETMGADPFSGTVHVFRAKRADRVKLVFWTDIARAEHNRDRLRFPSDLTDREWAVVAPMIPAPRPGGRHLGAEQASIPIYRLVQTGGDR